MNPEIDFRQKEPIGRDSEVASIRLSEHAQDELKGWLQKQPGGAGESRKAGPPGECRGAAEKHLPSLTIDITGSENGLHSNKIADNQSPQGTSGNNRGDNQSPQGISGYNTGDNQTTSGSSAYNRSDSTALHTVSGTSTFDSNAPATGRDSNSPGVNPAVASDSNPKGVNPAAVSEANPTEVNPPGNTIISGTVSDTNPTEVSPPATANISGSVGDTNPTDVNPPGNTNISGSAGVDSTAVGADTPPPQAPVEALGQAINASGVQQSSSVGDCFFLSALASVANTPNGPAEISSMITNNADGSHTVVFPGAKNVSINVTDADIKSDKLQNSAQWANVIEAAFLKYQHGSSVQSLVPQDDEINDLGNCQTSADALQLLTGQNATRDSNTFVGLGDQRITFGQTSAADLQHDLLTSLNNGNAVTAETGANWPILMNNGGPLVDSHVYSVLGYNTQTDTVTVRNPWGSAIDTPLSTPGTTIDGITSGNDGDLTMSFATFQSHFDTVNLANQNDQLTHGTHLVDDQIRLAQGEPNLVSQISDVASEANEGAYLATSIGWNALDSAVQGAAVVNGWSII